MCLPTRSELRPPRPSKFVLKKQFKNLQTFENTVDDADFDDVLSQTTQYTKTAIDAINDNIKCFQKSAAYKILFKTTQPAHLITAVAVAAIGLMLYPNSYENAEAPSSIFNLIYLGSFSIYFGTQIWMTFVSGLSLYFSLPRHHFGNVQRVLFPKYFLLNSLLCMLTLWIFVKRHQTEMLQILVLTTSFLINLLIRLYLAPPLLKLILMKNRIEHAAGIGMEIGVHDAGPLKNCPHYIKIHRSFRTVHMTIAIGNIITMACSVSHLNYLSHKLCDL
ncbi:PREDICTED: transmembrane protein 205 [Nicrophorus vespilloides]|uniref:Transmembrane protein 205 n=1 Tax=Nicrophorus vespilloides TaxID=110193 RepID=A0ABM1NGL4_NICVS|nr:PREDICTED: transmembrane protein 205 [Nicrophorus vespilloides]